MSASGLRAASSLVARLTRRELLAEGLPSSMFAGLEPERVILARAADRSVLGCMNDMAFLGGNEITRTGQRRHKRGNKYVTAIPGETSVAAGKTDTREGARHQKISRNTAKAKAVVATGNTQIRVFHALLSNPGTRYQDLGPDYYERRRDHHRQVSQLAGKLGALGYQVTLCRTPEAHHTPAA